MKKRRLLLVGAGCLMALIVATIWLSHPPVPFRFLEGAELEYEDLLSVSLTVDGTVNIPDTLIRHYRLRRTSGTEVQDVRQELLQKGWHEGIGTATMFRFASRTHRIEYVDVYPKDEGFVDVELISDASSFDKLRFRIGLRKRAQEGQGAWRITR